MFEKIWEEEKVFIDWKEGYFVKLLRKGDISNCFNYRGIVFFFVFGKVFKRFILGRLKDEMDLKLRN